MTSSEEAKKIHIPENHDIAEQKLCNPVFMISSEEYEQLSDPFHLLILAGETFG